MKNSISSKLGIVFILLYILFIPSLSLSASTEIISVSNEGIQGNSASGINDILSISGDGRYVAFSSQSDNLYPGFYGFANYIFDRTTRTIEPLCASIFGTQPNQPCDYPSMNSNGNLVVFESYATDLIPGDSGTNMDIFLRDRQNGTIEKISSGIMPSISGNGRYIAFNGYYGVGGLFVYDRTTTNVVKVDVDNAGNPGTGSPYGSSYPFISEDGRFVSFQSSHTNLAQTPDTNGMPDIFLHDRDADQDGILDEPGAISTIRVSVTSTGQQGTGYSTDPRISADGKFVIFRSSSPLVANDINSTDDIYVYNVLTSEVICASVDSNGIPAGAVNGAAINKDGKYIVFTGYDLVPEDTNYSSDVYVFNRVNGQISLTSLDNFGNPASGPNVYSGGAVIDWMGRFVSFASTADFVQPDVNGSVYDVFVRDRINNEIKHDGIDQDFNGYDLTIDITTATYRVNKSKLTVDATSSLGAAANLQLVGYGPMTYSGNKWTITVEPTTNPGTVTVSGPEGSETLVVTVQ